MFFCPTDVMGYQPVFIGSSAYHPKWKSFTFIISFIDRAYSWLILKSYDKKGSGDADEAFFHKYQAEPRTGFKPQRMCRSTLLQFLI